MPFEPLQTWRINPVTRQFCDANGNAIQTDSEMPRIYAFSNLPLMIEMVDYAIPASCNTIIVRVNNKFGKDSDGNWYTPIAEGRQTIANEDGSISLYLDSNITGVSDRLGESESLADARLEIIFANIDGDPTPDDVIDQCWIPIDYYNAEPLSQLPATPPETGTWVDQAMLAAAIAQVNGVTLGTALPQALGVAAAGNATAASPENHVHPMPSAADVGAIPLGTALPQALGVAAAGNATAASPENHVHPMPTAADVSAIPSAAKGASGGVASLDDNGKVPASQTYGGQPEIVEAANFAALPAVGTSNTIYITLNDNLEYRWGGSTYVEVSKSVALSTVAPPDLGIAAVGDSETAARSNHVHKMPTAADVFALPSAAKGAANGVAELGTDSKVPVNRIPGKPGSAMESWTIHDPANVYSVLDDICLIAALPELADLQIINVATDDPAYNVAMELRKSASFGARASHVAIADLTTTSGALSTTTFYNSGEPLYHSEKFLSVGNCLYVHFGSAPPATVKSVTITIGYQYAFPAPAGV